MTSATVFPDTTILIQYKPLNLVDWKETLGVDSIKLVLAPSVIQELKDIKNQDISSNLATRAAISLQSIENLQADSQKEHSVIKLFFPDEPKIDFLAENLDPNSVADILVASIISYQRTYALEYTVLFSEDQETTTKALAAGIEVKNLPEAYKVDLKSKITAASAALPLNPLFAAPSGSKEVFPISEPLASPSPLFPQSARQDRGAKKEPLKEPLKEPASPPLLSLSDIGINDLKLPEVPSHEELTEIPEKKKPVIQKVDLTDIVDIHDQSEETHQVTLPEEIVQNGNGAATPESPVPIINIIQEPARPDLQSANMLKGPLTVPEEPAPSTPPAEEEEQVPATASTDSPAIVTQSFSFISPGSTPISAPPPPAQNAFVPSEPNQEKSDLRLSIGSQDESRTTVVIHHPIYPSLDDVNKHLTSVRSNFPKLSLPYEAGGDGLGSDLVVKNMPYGSIAPDTILQRKAQRIKKYNTSLDTYYSGIEKYLSDNAEFDNFKRRSAKIDLTLFNDLPEDLKSLYISIHFPGNVRVYHDENLPERPASPPPPEEPDLEMLFDPIRLPQVPIPTELSTASDLKMRGRNPAPLEVRWNKGWDVIYSIREIEKQNYIPFNPIYIAFNSFDHATSFRINYRITVASASYEQLGELEIVVRKEI